MAGEAPLEFVVEPRSGDYDPLDERWLEQVSGLYGSLREEVGDVRREWRSEPGTKGDVSSIILALGSAGAFAAAAEVLRLFLDRGRDRWVTITHRTADGDVVSVDVRGDGLDADTFRQVALAAQGSAGHADDAAAR